MPVKSQRSPETTLPEILDLHSLGIRSGLSVLALDNLHKLPEEPDAVEPLQVPWNPSFEMGACILQCKKTLPKTSDMPKPLNRHSSMQHGAGKDSRDLKERVLTSEVRATRGLSTGTEAYSCPGGIAVDTSACSCGLMESRSF